MKSLAILTVLFLAANATAQNWNFSGSLENTLWLADDVPPAFLEFDDGYLLNPRLSLTFDYQPDPRFFLHATLRADRGFDPGTEPDGELRFDEVILRYRPFGDNLLNIQLGKFPTIVGNWVPNHDFHEDPFILAPLPYSEINGINVNNPLGSSPAAIETRSKLSGATIHRLKENWSSIIWGPAYSNGLSIFGNTDAFDYAIEIKNSGLGSQPSEWNFGEGDFEMPNISARLGYRPDAAWALGLSANRSYYLNVQAEDVLTPGMDRADFTQDLIGVDLRWSHHDWLLSGEFFYASYDTPHEDLENLSYYLQARYKAAPGLWIAGRFGQTLSNEVATPSGGQAPWSPDYLRAELALGWRITPDVLLKTQYAYTLVTNDLSEPSKNLLILSLGWRF